MTPFISNPLYQRTSGIPDPADLPPYEHFIKSMEIGYMEWHDGIGYAIEEFPNMDDSQLQRIESILIERKDRDWRDVEALAALNTPAAAQALKDCLHNSNLEARLFAVRYLKELNIQDSVEEVLLKTLPETTIGGGMTFALQLIESYPTERLKQLLLWCSQYGNKDIRIHCAALALYLYGVTDKAFDGEQKIIFAFREENPEKRRPAFLELCRMVNVYPDRLPSFT